MLTEEPVRELLFATSDSFSDAVNLGLKKTDLPASMRLYLQDNTFRFAGFKTHREMQAASRLLLDDEGNLKPFNRFLNDVQTIDKTYNGSYLQAEYNFAVASAQSAASWQDFVKDGDSFYLRYRTAGDERVRESHRLLDGITLPPADPFWNEFFPPNDWNCRCSVIQISKSKAQPSNSSEAIVRGRSATFRPNSKGENKAQIFRFNPGKTGKIFPDKHPYFPKGCKDCSLNRYSADYSSETCKACLKILWAQKDSRNKGRKEIENYIKENINGKVSFSHPAFGGLIATPNKDLYRELYHVGGIAKLSKTYDTLMHLERYLTEDANVFQEKVIHNHNGGAEKIFVLQSEYKGDWNMRKGEIVQIIFRQSSAQDGSSYLRFYFVRNWFSVREYDDWAKKTGRKIRT